jgi:hypothetical protein
MNHRHGCCFSTPLLWSFGFAPRAHQTGKNPGGINAEDAICGKGGINAEDAINRVPTTLSPVSQVGKHFKIVSKMFTTLK